MGIRVEKPPLLVDCRGPASATEAVDSPPANRAASLAPLETAGTE